MVLGVWGGAGSKTISSLVVYRIPLTHTDHVHNLGVEDGWMSPWTHNSCWRSRQHLWLESLCITWYSVAVVPICGSRSATNSHLCPDHLLIGLLQCALNRAALECIEKFQLLQKCSSMNTYVHKYVCNGCQCVYGSNSRYWY